MSEGENHEFVSQPLGEFVSDLFRGQSGELSSLLVAY